MSEQAPVQYLSVEDLLALVRVLGVGPVRDLGLLDAAAARPASHLFGQQSYPALELKAAALLESVTNHHALVDGNTRLGWLAAVVFLDLNGFRCTLSQDDAFTLVWDIAAGDLELRVIAERLPIEPK